jgi:hypothetical protein
MFTVISITLGDHDGHLMGFCPFYGEVPSVLTDTIARWWVWGNDEDLGHCHLLTEQATSRYINSVMPLIFADYSAKCSVHLYDLS